MTPAAELDSFLCRLCLYREARGESMAGKAAILAVIRNRAEDKSGRWPNTLAGVVIQPSQFSSFNKGEPNSVVWPHAPKPGAPSGLDWVAWLQCGTVYDSPLTADPTGGANFYHDTSIQPPAEAWLGKGRTVAELLAFKTCEIGRLRFYRIPVGA